MTVFILRRLAFSVVTLLVASFLVFGGLELAPGSPVAALSGGQPLTQAQEAAIIARYHLDDPFLQRFFAWWADLLRGDLGVSIAQQDTVANLIWVRLGTTTMLVTMATVFVLTLGIVLGLVAAFSPRWVELAISWLTTVGLSTPPFFYALLFISVFAVHLGWFPVFGAGDDFLDKIWHLTLPAVALALADCALLSRIVRNSAREEAVREYVDTARAQGLPYLKIVRRHILRNSLVPTVTIAGLTVAALVGGTAVIETVFGIDGIGNLLVTAATNQDFAIVQILSLGIVAIFLLTNLVVDILYRVLDPRMAAVVSS